MKYLIRLEHHINGDDSDHQAFLVEAEDHKAALLKCANEIADEFPDWIEEFDPFFDDWKDVVSIEQGRQAEKSARKVFIEYFLTQKIPVLHGYYRGVNTHVLVEIPYEVE